MKENKSKKLKDLEQILNLVKVGSIRAKDIKRGVALELVASNILEPLGDGKSLRLTYEAQFILRSKAASLDALRREIRDETEGSAGWAEQFGETLNYLLANDIIP